jgi:hypothetical protein
LGVCVTKAAARLQMDELALERWIALQVTNLTSDMFETQDKDKEENTQNDHLALTFRNERKKASAGRSALLSKFRLSVGASNTRRLDMSTQTPKMVRVEEAAADADILAHHNTVGLGETYSEAPLYRQGYDEAIRRQKSSLFAHNKGVNSNSSVLRPLPRLLFAEQSVTVPAPEVVGEKRVEDAMMMSNLSTSTQQTHRLARLALDHTSRAETSDIMDASKRALFTARTRSELSSVNSYLQDDTTQPLLQQGSVMFREEE